jgi:hypothetical protein
MVFGSVGGVGRFYSISELPMIREAAARWLRESDVRGHIHVIEKLFELAA